MIAEIAAGVVAAVVRDVVVGKACKNLQEQNRGEKDQQERSPLPARVQGRSGWETASRGLYGKMDAQVSKSASRPNGCVLRGHAKPEAPKNYR